VVFAPGTQNLKTSSAWPRSRARAVPNLTAPRAVLAELHSAACSEISMYRPKDIAEAMGEIFDDPKWEGGMGGTTIAWRNLWDRVASETGLSEEALRLLMKEGFLLRVEQKRQMGM
jgi:hypothetical protein